MILFLPESTLTAQNPRGTLRGVVQDMRGGRIPSSRIVVRATESSFRREVTTNDRGEFRVEDLLPGVYHLTVNAAGFAEANSEVKVAISTVREMTVTLLPQ